MSNYRTHKGGLTLTGTGVAYAQELGLEVATDHLGCQEACRPKDEGGEPVDLNNIKADSYVWLTDADTWSDTKVTEEEMEAANGRAQAWLTENQGPLYSIKVRPAQPSEIVDIYSVEPDGRLQILGSSLSLPEAVNNLTNQAWQHACDTWPMEGGPEELPELAEVTEAMRVYNQDAAPGGECNAYQDLNNELQTLDRGNADDVENLVDYWTAVAEGRSNEYAAETGAKIQNPGRYAGWVRALRTCGGFARLLATVRCMAAAYEMHGADHINLDDLELLADSPEVEEKTPDLAALFGLAARLTPTVPETAAHCSCDDPGDSPCPKHRRENDLQNRAIKAESRVAELEAWKAGAEGAEGELRGIAAPLEPLTSELAARHKERLAEDHYRAGAQVVNCAASYVIRADGIRRGRANLDTIAPAGSPATLHELVDQLTAAGRHAATREEEDWQRALERLADLAGRVLNDARAGATLAQLVGDRAK